MRVVICVVVRTSVVRAWSRASRPYSPTCRSIVWKTRCSRTCSTPLLEWPALLRTSALITWLLLDHTSRTTTRPSLPLLCRMPGCSSSGCLPLAHEVIVIITIIHSNNNYNTTKYSNIQARHIFQPVAVQSLGPVNVCGLVFLFKLGRKLLISRRRQRNQFFISATLLCDSAVQCHLTAWLFCDVLWRRRRSKVLPSLIFVLFCIA